MCWKHINTPYLYKTTQRRLHHKYFHSHCADKTVKYPTREYQVSIASHWFAHPDDSHNQTNHMVTKMPGYARFCCNGLLCEGNSLVTGELPSQNAGNTELWCFHWWTPTQTVKQTVNLPVIWDAVTPTWRHCKVKVGCWTNAFSDTFQQHLISTLWVKWN